MSARYLLEDGIAGVNVRPEFVIKGTINGQPMFVINNPYSTYHN